MVGTDIAVFEEAHRVCVSALRGALDRDWSVQAGSLVWPATLTAAHLTDVLFSYAFQAAAHGTRGTLPFEELHAGPGADPEGLVDGIHASGVMLASVLHQMPDDATSWWWGRAVAAPEWAEMGTRETLLHCYDIAVGLGVDLVPPTDVAWPELVRASGRPFGEDEWTAWRAESDARRSRPAPPGSEAGVLGDFADGILTAPFGRGWRSATDERMGGTSSAALEVVAPGPPGLAHALRIEGAIEESEAALNLAGATFLAADKEEGVANLSAWEGVRFWVRGAERPFAVWSLNAEGSGGRHVVPLSEDWTPHRLPFHWFGSDGSDLRGLMFAVDTALGDYWFELGDVRLY